LKPYDIQGYNTRTITIDVRTDDTIEIIKQKILDQEREHGCINQTTTKGLIDDLLFVDKIDMTKRFEYRENLKSGKNY